MTNTNSFVLDCRGFDVNTAGLTSFFGVGFNLAGGNGDNFRTQRKAQTAHTDLNMSLYINANTNGQPQSLVSINNGSTGNQAVTIVDGGAHTGWLTDSSHTDSITAGNYESMKQAGAGANPINVNMMAMTVQNTSPLSYFSLSSNTGSSANVGGADFIGFNGAGGLASNFTAEDHRSKTVVRGYGTAKDMQVAIGATGAGVTVQLRKNGSNGNQSIVTSASAIVQDTSHTDSISAGDAVNYSTSAGISNFYNASCDVAGTTSAHDCIWGVPTSDGSSTTSMGTADLYAGISGSGGWHTVTNKARALATVAYATTASRLYIDIQTNTEANSTHVEFYNNGASGNQSLLISAATTTAVEDTSHTDSVGAAHTAGYHFVSNAGSGAIAPNWIRMLLDDGSVSGSSTETGTGVLSFGSLSFSGAGNDHTASGKLAFGQLAFVSAGSAALAATGRLAFGQLAFVGAGAASHIGTGRLAFGPLAFVASGQVSHTGSGKLAFGALKLIVMGADTVGGASAANPAVPTAPLEIQPLTWNVPISAPETGFPTPEFMKKWSKQFDVIKKQFEINQTIIPRTYIDKQDVATLNAAITSANTAANNALISAKAYTDAALVTAKAYTDARITLGTTVAGLPAGSTGARGFVTDSTQTLAAGLGLAVVGGSTNKVPVYYDGSAWLIG